MVEGGRGEKRRSIRTSGNAKRDLGELKLGPLLRSTQRRKKEDRVKDFRIGGIIAKRRKKGKESFKESSEYNTNIYNNYSSKI